MAYMFPPDLDQLVREQLANGEYESEDDVLREALRALSKQNERCQEYDDTVAAVTEGVADIEAGRMRPLRDALDEARAKAEFSSD